MTEQEYKLICILGATASGKTSLACNLAIEINAEIISADSRQVYRGMSIGTGKDIEDYRVNGVEIPYHLIDITDAGNKYNVFEYQRDFLSALADIKSRRKEVILCGGSGMYIEAVLKGYRLINVPNNEVLRDDLENKTDDDLTALLASYKSLHNISDTSSRKRLIRAIEIADYYSNHTDIDTSYPKINSIIFGVKFDRESRRRRITERLKYRLEHGMIDEVKQLLDAGISPEQLIFYGLEYKFLTQYVLNELTYEEMFSALNTAIHQFAKRQATWFRRMEKNGFKIHWLDGYIPMKEKIEKINSIIMKESFI